VRSTVVFPQRPSSSRRAFHFAVSILELNTISRENDKSGKRNRECGFTLEARFVFLVQTPVSFFTLAKANPEYVNLRRWSKEAYGSHRRRALDEALGRMRARLGFFVSRGSTSSCLMFLFFSTGLPVSHWPNFLRIALLPDSKYSARVRRWDGKSECLANPNAERYDSVTGLIRDICHRMIL